MFILYAILIASVGLSAPLADASAIKGHARPHEEVARSIKLAPVNNNIDKAAKSIQSPAAAAAAPSAPILESTKKIYNDESIRRLAAPVVQSEQGAVKSAAPVVVEPIAVVAQQAPVAAVVKPVVAEPVVVAAAAVAQPVQPIVEQQPAAAAPVVVKEVAPVQAAAVMEGKSAAAAPVVAEPAVVVAAASKPAAAPQAADELPQQSERSAVPVAAASEPQAVAAPIVAAPQQPAVSEAVVIPVAPVVVVQQAQPEPSVVAAIIKDSPLQAKKAEAEAAAPVAKPVAEPVAVASAPGEPLLIEVPAPDPGLVLSEPIDSTTKLLIDLDEHVRKFLPAEDQQQAAQPQKDQTLVAGIDYSPPAAGVADPTGKSSGPLAPYSSSASEDAIVPPLPSLDGVEKASGVASSPSSSTSSGAAAPGSPVSSSSSSSSSSSGSSSSVSSPSATRQGGQHQNQQQVITQLLDQLDSLQNRIQDTINQLVSRRRYVMSALLRPMGTYVRRVRTNLERLQNRVNQLQAAAVSVGGGQNRPTNGFVDAAAIETIRRRIDDISKRISDIVNRIRFSLTPTSAPLNSNGRK